MAPLTNVAASLYPSYSREIWSQFACSSRSKVDIHCHPWSTPGWHPWFAHPWFAQPWSTRPGQQTSFPLLHDVLPLLEALSHPISEAQVVTLELRTSTPPERGRSRNPQGATDQQPLQWWERAARTSKADIYARQGPSSSICSVWDFDQRCFNQYLQIFGFPVKVR